MGDGELVTAATFHSLGAAHIAKGALESAGIECVLTDENISGAYGGVAVVGIRLQVYSKDVEGAIEILSAVESQSGEESPQAIQNVCPKCGASRIRFVETKLFALYPPHWECEECRARWMVEPD